MIDIQNLNFSVLLVFEKRIHYIILIKREQSKISKKNKQYIFELFLQELGLKVNKQMTTMDKFNCKIDDKYDITCELIQTNIKFRVKCQNELLLYQAVYFNDTLPIQYKVLFSNNVVKLFNYIKNKPVQKLKFKANQLIVVFDLIGEQKYLYLPLQKKQFDAKDLLPIIQRLKNYNESLIKINGVLFKEKQYFKEKYQTFKQETGQQLDQMRQEIDNLRQQLQRKKIKQLQKKQKQKQKQKEEEQIYDSQQSEEQEEDNHNHNHNKFSVLRPPNMSFVKDELVIVWNQKKDIVDSVDDLKDRRPDCLTIKITGQQGQNGNQGIKELSQILPRVHQLKYLKILNLYFSNTKFGKGISLNYWPVLRAAIIAHLKIKFVNFIIGPKTWKSNKLSLLKQIQLYPKKIVINTQILYWK